MGNSWAEKAGSFIRDHKLLHYPAKIINRSRRAMVVTYRQGKYLALYKWRCAGHKSQKFQEFGHLKDKYAGKRCFIVCTGPSLLAKDLDALKNEVCFSMNSIYKMFDKTDWRPSYYSIIDPDVYAVIKNDNGFMNMANALVPDIFVKKHGSITLKKYIQYPMENNELHWHRLTGAPLRFTDDALAMVFDVATVTYALMQIAVFMGCKEIYLLGCDCNYSGQKQHFADYGTKLDNAARIEDNLFLAFTTARNYADSHGIKIYNATRGGKLEVFERVDFDSLF